MDLKRIDELASGLEWYLKQLSNFTSELKDVRDALRELRESYERSQNYEVQLLKQQLASLTEAFKQHGVVLPNNYELELENIRNLLEGSEWPLAVPEGRICDTESKQVERANGIINIFVSEYLKDKKFLDFGCGEGQVVLAANKNEASYSIGYDIKKKWDEATITELTTQGEKLLSVFLTDDWALVEASRLVRTRVFDEVINIHTGRAIFSNF